MAIQEPQSRRQQSVHQPQRQRLLPQLPFLLQQLQQSYQLQQRLNQPQLQFNQLQQRLNQPQLQLNQLQQRLNQAQQQFNHLQPQFSQQQHQQQKPQQLLNLQLQAC